MIVKIFCYDENFTTFLSFVIILQLFFHFSLDKDYPDNKLIKEIAKEMKKANKPIEEIIQFTGLTKEEVEKL